jgi:hypothetical protein
MILGYRARRGTGSHRLATGFLLVSIVQSTICLALPLQTPHAAFAKVGNAVVLRIEKDLTS